MSFMPFMSQTSSHSGLRAKRQGWRKALLVSTALVLTACQTTSTGDTLAGAGPETSYGDVFQGGEMSPGVKYWAAKMEANPRDVPTAIGFSKQLRSENQFDDAIGVMLQASANSPNDPRVLAELGKILIERGAPNEGLALLDQAADTLTTDWTIMSARGVALDQLGRHDEAQQAFEKALTYSPDNPVVLTNLGLSLATEGRLDEAENMLRKANAQPKAPDTVALNLALILGLKGDFEESELIARDHLPPATVEENMAYLKSLLAQPVRWQHTVEDPADGDQPEY